MPSTHPCYWQKRKDLASRGWEISTQESRCIQIKEKDSGAIGNWLFSLGTTSKKAWSRLCNGASSSKVKLWGEKSPWMNVIRHPLYTTLKVFIRFISLPYIYSQYSQCSCSHSSPRFHKQVHTERSIVNSNVFTIFYPFMYNDEIAPTLSLYSSNLTNILLVLLH